MSTSKTALAAIVGALLTTAVWSQAEFRGGALLGMITSQIQGDDFSGFNKFGLHAGGFVDVGFNDQSSVLLEMLYSQKGSRNAPDLINNPDNANVFKWKINYIELPVSYNHRFTDRLSAHAGAYVGIVVNGFQEINGARSDLDGAFTKSDIGLQVGGQYHGQNSFLRIRYSGSALPMRDGDAQSVLSPYWRSGGYNIVLYLAYGFMF